VVLDRLSITLPKTVKDSLRVLADERQLSQSSLVVQSLQDFIDRAYTQEPEPEEDLTITIKLETLDQKRHLEHLARQDRRTIEDMAQRIFSTVLEHYPLLYQTSQIEYRSFIDLLRLYLGSGELGQLLCRFVEYLAEGNRLPQTDCLRIAALLGWEPEQFIEIRDRCTRQTDNGVDCVSR
jgi:predicted transcriptional regulator